MRFTFISIILHIAIITCGYSLRKEKSFQIDTIGTTMEANNIAINFNQAKPMPPLPPPISEPEPEIEPEPEPETPEPKKIEPEPEKKVEEIRREVITPKEEKKEKPKPKPKKKVEPQKPQPPKETNVTAPTSHEGIIEISKGVYAAKNQGVKGLSYSFISNPDPEYPELAKKMGIRKEVVVRVRFLVGLDGKIEEVKFYNQEKDLGFKAEIEKVLKEWKLTPVTIEGKKIKLYFYKEFKFNLK
jgi:protein TonB